MPTSFTSIGTALKVLAEMLPKDAEINISNGRIHALSTGTEEAQMFELGKNVDSCVANDLEAFLRVKSLQVPC
jgi:hypothetical protein